MIERLALRITKRMLDRQIIAYEDSEIYQFGLHSLIVLIINFSGLLLLAVLLNSLGFILLFFLPFYLLRSYTGGLHLKGDWLCFFCSLLVIVGLCFGKNSSLGFTLELLIFTVGLLSNFWLAPVDNKNRVLSASEKSKAKSVSKIILTMIIACKILAMLFGLPVLDRALFYVIVVNSTSLLLGKYFRYRESSLFL